MEAAAAYRNEAVKLRALLDRHGPEALGLVTGFKSWSVADVVGHLHMFDVAARLSLEDALGRSENAFPRFFAPVGEALAEGREMMDAQRRWLADEKLEGEALVERWSTEAERLAALFADADPKLRVAWAGPDMSARSAATARQMETWAHGHEVFDRLGERRAEDDGLRNIAHLGVATFAWSFRNRGEEPPGPRPAVALRAPGGAVWEWEGGPDRVTGSALGFCQTVTQTRNVADTDIRAEGTTARAWMEKAQCYAGPAHRPPGPGERGVTPRRTA